MPTDILYALFTSNMDGISLSPTATNASLERPLINLHRRVSVAVSNDGITENWGKAENHIPRSRWDSGVQCNRDYQA